MEESLTQSPMDEPESIPELTPPTPAESVPWSAPPPIETPDAPHARSSPWRRRVIALATAGVVAAFLSAWSGALIPGWFAGFTGPRGIVRVQIEDLGNGKVRAAYDLFSQGYRERMPFNTWRSLVTTHWGMFRTREVIFSGGMEWNGRAVLEAHVVADSGDRYIARFTLIRFRGRWWVDDLSWVRDPDDRGRIST